MGLLALGATCNVFDNKTTKASREVDNGTNTTTKLDGIISNMVVMMIHWRALLGLCDL